MEIRKVPYAHGWMWIKQGFYLILKNPILSIVLAGVLATGIFLLFNIPLLGLFFGMLLAPALVAGYMRALQASEQHEEMELAHLFAGFGKRAPQLITLGGILLVGVITASGVTTSIGGEALITFLEKAQSANDPQVIMDALLAADPVVTQAMLIGMSLLLLLSVCMQFAPMLVIFNGAKPMAAIKGSILGTFRNIVSYMIYGLIFQVLSFVAGLLPIYLSILLLLPIGLASLYAAYCDIYTGPKELTRAVEGDAVTHEDQAHP
jgi:hypothetical protein